MSASDELRLLKELYLPPADEFVLVEVPEMQFVMLDGEGHPVQRGTDSRSDRTRSGSQR